MESASVHLSMIGKFAVKQGNAFHVLPGNHCHLRCGDLPEKMIMQRGSSFDIVAFSTGSNCQQPRKVVRGGDARFITEVFHVALITFDCQRLF